MLGFSESAEDVGGRISRRKNAKKDDAGGSMDIDETLFQRELHDGNARVDARHLRVTPEEMRQLLEEEQRAAQERAALREREERERKERATEVIRRYKEEDRAAKEREIRENAWRYALQKAKEEREEREHPERKHQRELAAINTQLSELLAVKREQEKDFWSFMPSKRRARARLEEEIGMLKTRERVERMRIADLTGEYHKDLREKRTKEALEPFFDALRRPKKEEPNPQEVAEVSKQMIRELYKEKIKLQAKQESFFMVIRPFKRREIENRLTEIENELRTLQQEVRNARQAAEIKIPR